MLLKLSDTMLALRPITTGDESLLFRIYASTRKEEMERVPHWSDDQKHAFLWQQFQAQHHFYQQQYPGAFFYLLTKRETPVGRLYISPDYYDGSIRLMDITLLPEFRGQGIGESVLRDIIAFAREKGRPITIHVESFNPAMRLYRRLGFELKSQTNEVYHLLEWKDARSVLQPVGEQYK